MKTATKVWLIIAAALTVIGAAVCAYAVSAEGFVPAEFETDTVEVSESFLSIAIRCDTEDVTLLPSGDGTCSVTFFTPEKARPAVSVQDGTLVIETAETGEWYESFLRISFDAPKLTVCLPQSEYDLLSVAASTGDITIPQDFTFESVNISVSTGDVACRADAARQLRIATSTGDIRVEHVTVGMLELSVSTGRTALTDVTCKSLSSVGSTGDLTMSDVAAAGTITIERSTGNVHMERCDAAELEIATDTGDVTGSLRSEKIFFAQSDTGDVNVPETTTGGKCRITTDTGEIWITVP
ncbi:MAG: DUF4097 family beta strand repeat protein [Oscillospiraceae bacterium]|nr:DUF4097 family beta strand repeat protein [Oscillospiraceae bacterium]